MTYLELINKLSLTDCGAPSLEAAEIIRIADGHSREWCLLNQNTPLSDSVTAILNQRLAGIPLQYICGEAWFFGYRFHVTPHCLIPQPDTEHLVSQALKHIHANTKLLDLCTGSGCIPISILNESDDVSAVAIDISKDALAIAQKNAEFHNVSNRLAFLCSDVLFDDPSTLISDADIITSNPPYINSDVIPKLSPEVQHEPRIALDGGADGMIFYNHFISVLSKHMKDKAIMLLEIGYDQAQRIQRLCDTNGLCCRLHKDFGGNLRVAEINK